MSLGKIGKLTNVFNAFKQSPFSNKSDMISSLAAFGNINKAASYLNKVNSDGAISNTASKMLLYKAYAASGITKEEAGEALNNNLAGSSKFGLLGNIKNVGSGIAAVFKSIAPMMIPLIIGAAGIKAGKMLWDNVLTDNAAQKNLQESVQKYKTEKSDLDNLQSQKETNKQRVYELRAKSNRTAAEDNELNNLLNEDSILDAQIGLKKRTVTSAQKQQALDAKKALEKRTFQGELFGKSPYPVYQDTNIGYAQKLMSGLEDEKQARKDVLNNKEWSSERKEAELKAKDKTIVSYETELADVMSDISSNAQDLYDEDGNLIDKKNTQDLANNINDLFKAYSMLTNSSDYVSDKMDNIFALSKFSNLKDKLIEAGKSGGTDAIKDLISQTKDLDEAMSNAGIDADDLADGIMAIADPDAKNLEGIKDNLKDIFGKKYSFFKDKNDEDIEGFWDYLQDNNLNPEKMKWGKEDISDNWEDYLNSKRSTEIVDDTTFASRFKNSAEDTATDLDTITDNFQTDMSSIKSSMDAVYETCEYVDGYFDGKDLANMTQVELYTLMKMGLEAKSLSLKDTLDFKLGVDYSYGDIEEHEVISTATKFDGTNYIDTGLKIMEKDRDFTIAIDFEFDSGNSVNSTLAQCFQGDGSNGFRLWYSQEPRFSWNTDSITPSAGTNREIIVFRHEAGSQKLYVYNSNMTGKEVSSTTLNAIRIPEHSSTLVFGCSKILKELVDGKAPSSHTHTKSEVGLGNVDNTADATKSVKYAISAGSASSAAALTSNAGSSTQPVYFSGGKPVACSYTLGKSVPADALFTDHTYGNMKGATSSSAGSAGLVPAPNIGEQLKFLRADGAWVIPTNTTYSVGTSSYLGITKLYTETGSATDGTMTQNAITTALNGKSPTSHTHNYAGSSSSGGAANSANKLATARTVSGGTDITLSFNYDGSGNSSANIGFYSSSASVGDKNNYPFHRFAKLDTIAASYSDKSTTFFISQDYSGGGFGIVRIVLRTNNSSLASTVEVKWLVRCGLSADSVQVGIYNVFGKTYADAFFKTGGSYAGTCFRTLASGARGGISRTWVLVNSSEVSGTSATDAKTSTECYATIAAAGTALHKQAYSSIVSGTDSGTASYANSAGSANSVAWGNVTGKPSTFAPSSHTHNYAGSSSAGGAATSANKLSTPRKIGNASFDGTADITLSQMGLNVPVEITKANYLAKKKAGTLNANTYYNVIDEYDSANVINDSSVTANSAFSSTKSEKTYAKKSTLVNTTLTASKWTGSSAPYSYVLSVSGVTSSNIVEIDYASNASSAAIEAYQNAMLADGGQTTNQITIKATEKPTVDIPITIVIRNDL